MLRGARHHRRALSFPDAEPARVGDGQVVELDSTGGALEKHSSAGHIPMAKKLAGEHQSGAEGGQEGIDVFARRGAQTPPDC
ncbi:MAG: hypothetical protein ABIS15_03480 [Gemmatimonadaceae bacterium]